MVRINVVSVSVSYLLIFFSLSLMSCDTVSISIVSYRIRTNVFVSKAKGILTT